MKTRDEVFKGDGEGQPPGPFGCDVNKQGQKLGAKGRRTRQSLMTAARELLRTCSPIDLSAVSIAKSANIAPASFYMYFDGVRDLLYEMSDVAGQEYETLIAILDERWDFSALETEHALRFVRAFDEIWERHREVLLFRNLEADRGDPQFEDLRVKTLRPIVQHLGQKIREASRDGQTISVGDARAEAAVLMSAMERNAAADPKLVARELGIKRLERAMASVIARSLQHRDRRVAGN